MLAICNTPVGGAAEVASFSASLRGSGRIPSDCGRVMSVRSVAEAANEMGVSVERVRQLIATGQVRAVRVGSRWVLDDAPSRSVVHPVGRPWSAEAVWGLLWVGLGQPVSWLSVKQRQRAWHRWQEGLEPHVDRCRSRCNVCFFRGHPAAIRRLASDRRVVLGGVSAAGLVGADLVVGEDFEAYVRSTDLEALVSELGLELASGANANVVLRSLDGVWPFGDDERQAPALVVAFDLIESGDQRTQRAGRSLLARELKRLRKP